MKTRDFYFDNIKTVLIVLVIFGHLLEFSVVSNPMSKQIYTMIYFFHMPAFVLISGYFAKKSTEKIDVKNLLWKIGLPYIIFQTLYLYFHNYLFEYQFEHTLMSPYWILWFLFSLIIWHILTYIFSQFKYGIYIAIVVGLAAGIYQEFGLPLSLSRTLVFFPFFYLGVKMKKKHFEQLRKPAVKIFSFALIGYVFYSLEAFALFDHSFLWSSSSYAFFGYEEWDGVYRRAVQYGVGFLVSMAFFSLIPAKKNPLSQIGNYTLYIFLLHGFLVKLIQYNYPDFLLNANVTSYFHFFFIALGFSFLFTLKYIRNIFSPFVEPQNFLKPKVTRRNRS